MILNNCFKSDKELINKEKFLDLVRNVNSEIFIYVHTQYIY